MLIDGLYPCLHRVGDDDSENDEDDEERRRLKELIKMNGQKIRVGNNLKNCGSKKYSFNMLKHTWIVVVFPFLIFY